MAILQQTVFSPRYGFDMQHDKINSFIANSVLAYGKIVEPAASTGVLSLGDEYGYFLYEEVTSDGPSQLEIEMGDYQYEKKASDTTAVTVIIPRKGAIVRTKWVSSGSTALAAGVTLDISTGVYVSGASAAAGTKGKILNIVTDSLSNTLYDVEIL